MPPNPTLFCFLGLLGPGFGSIKAFPGEMAEGDRALIEVTTGFLEGMAADVRLLVPILLMVAKGSALICSVMATGRFLFLRQVVSPIADGGALHCLPS